MMRDELSDCLELANRVLDRPFEDPDSDIVMLSRQLIRAIEAKDILMQAIRKHRDMRGDDRCYQDDHDLYLILPEGDTRPETEVAVTIENCQRYIECRQSGREYVSPQRRIKDLEIQLLHAIDALREAQSLVCSYHCPCVKKTGEEWTHSPECNRISQIVKKAESDHA